MSTPAAPVAGGGGPTSYQSQFNAAYKASKPPQFGPFYDGSLQTADARWALFAQMLAQGFGPLDEEIEGEGFDPYECMWMRSVRYGQTWEPAGMGATATVTLSTPGAVVTPGMYQGPVPAGQIKVSLLLSANDV